ncbi:amidase [Gemmatimonadetes bacterium T265]|nr:amidase [Gemmatimonadetes bacterium T265]
MPTTLDTTERTARTPDRRTFMRYFAGTGLGATLFPGVLWAKVAGGADLTPATVAAAEEVAGLHFEPAERQMLLDGLKHQAQQLDALHALPLDNAVAPAIHFDPLGALPPDARAALTTRLGGPEHATAPAPARTPHVTAVPGDADLAFQPVTALGELLRTRQVTSTQLTRLALDRIRRYDPMLKCVITVTEARALQHAAAADDEIARGRYRGPLHGIPWGAKDLLAAKGYPTTWGAGPYRDQVIDEDAEVVRRLDAAGAVLVAKLTLGELAQGDVWFGRGPTDATGEEARTRSGQRTRNPWKPDQGSSGSSAGPASATAAGLVAFAIGSETLGSISSPSTRCGTTGLRPTFGRVPRTGAMALSWSMDKLGPIARSAADCALVLDAVRGPDGRDATCVVMPYAWRPDRPLGELRVGYVRAAFDAPASDPKDPKRVLHPTKPFDDAALAVLRDRLGVRLVPVELPDAPYDAMRLILTAEAAAAFDELTRTRRDRQLVQQGPFDWPNTFRTARFIPAVDYINANRHRTLAVRRWEALFSGEGAVDVIVTPTFAAGFTQLVATNLTGHPAVVVPSGFRDDGTPVSITFLGRLFGEADALRVAAAYQGATDFHTRRPPAFA